MDIRLIKIHRFLLGLVIIGIFFITYSYEYVYSLPNTKSEEILFLINGDHPSESCQCVAFRLDDFTDTSLTMIKIQIVETFYQKNIPLTIGIVGDRFGENEEFVNYVLEKIMDDNFELEVGNHGWKHENFSNLDIHKQSDLLKKTNDKVEKTLGIRPKVFIPPYNQFNSDTLEALRHNEMRYYSAGAKKNSTVQYQLSNSDLYHFPASSSTGTQDPESKKFNGLSYEITLKFILRSINKYGFAVVMMHPYEFSVIKNSEYTNEINWQQIKELEHLIDAIRDYDLRMVSISKINNELVSAEPIIPESLRQIIQKWSDGSLSDSKFIDTIHNMRQEMIITYPQLVTKIRNEQHVPVWFKNTVTWWLDGKISSKDMVNSIEYLLKKGIMRI